MPEPLTADEVREMRVLARRYQVEHGFVKACPDCGRTLPVGAFPFYGAAVCRTCRDRRLAAAAVA